MRQLGVREKPSIWSLRQSMDTTWQEGTRLLKERRNEGLKITETSWRVANRPRDRLLFQCVDPSRERSIPNRISSLCIWLARKRGRKTKTTKLIAGGIGSTWVQLKRINPSPSPTHSS
ncbi:hypothetical protein H5410_045590 [Solanum commersonii]|uniref:Uncharacterized protein n=1 Tax=Solanum commersonii TaxID=4109 RepID=A0A9J5XD66_SOLCO|nr:hypothetical protein H5410_045590 [Solanum commersonii]